MAQKKKPNWGYFASLALSVGLALAAGAIIMWAAGYNPVEAYGALLQGATGCDTIGEFFTELFTKRQFGNTLEYTMVLALTGLACALGARAGIFNVGFCSPAALPGWPFRQLPWGQWRWAAHMPGFPAY